MLWSFPHRLLVLGHRIRPSRKPPGLPAQEPRAGDRPCVRHCQQHRFHAVLPAAASFCCRRGPGDGLLEPKAGLPRGPCSGHLSSVVRAFVFLHDFSINLLIPSYSLPNFILLISHLLIYNPVPNSDSLSSTFHNMYLVRSLKS